MTVQAVVFDLGGTLTAPGPPLDTAEPWRQYAAAAGLSDAATAVDRLLAAEHMSWLACRDNHLSFTFQRILDAAGVPRDPQGTAAYRGAWEPVTRAAPEARGVLTALARWGLRIGLLSNTVWPADWHRDALRRDGLLALFDATVFSSDLAVAKPHTEAFGAVLRALGGVAPDACVHVGDRLFEDVLGASRAGLRTVLLPDTSVPSGHQMTVAAEPDARVLALSAVPGVVEDWLWADRASLRRRD
ncbi:HAD family hydrolase [Streptomyces sp. NPDC058252]|uniref:HAD family hydrolase n=1 Tax=Streptomyces sp. NPDC058252 TaxID=3346405 RepID=UPI0036E8C703